MIFIDKDWKIIINQVQVVLAMALFLASLSVNAQERIFLPRTGLISSDIAVIVNDDDPLSQQVAYYYQQARGIPNISMIHVRFPTKRSSMTPTEFKQLKTRIDQLTPHHIQAYVVSWTHPYRVGCMSLTSSLAFGFDKKYCAKKCGSTSLSPYFNSQSLYPASDHGLRPAMMLAGTSFENVKTLIIGVLLQIIAFLGGKLIY